ncbi:MAG: hypothetical protein FWD49_05250, partial [Firmicutes bacterium]|nr:hypothetical protein [Bacillota bacterium]
AVNNNGNSQSGDNAIKQIRGGGTLKVKGEDGSVNTYQGEEAERIISAYRASGGLNKVPLMATATQIFKILSISLLIFVFIGGIVAIVVTKNEKEKKKQA